MRKYLALTAVLASLLSASAANASLLGQKVYGHLGVNTTDPLTDSSTIAMENWGVKTVGSDLEFHSTDDGNVLRANFNDVALLVSDVIRPKATADGWKMGFRLPDFTSSTVITLVKSSFPSGLTYSVTPNGFLTIVWAGDKAFEDMSSGDRRAFGMHTFTASFRFSNVVENAIVNDVPEPATWALFAAGLLGLTAFGWSRRKPVLGKIRSA